MKFLNPFSKIGVYSRVRVSVVIFGIPTTKLGKKLQDSFTSSVTSYRSEYVLQDVKNDPDNFLFVHEYFG